MELIIYITIFVIITVFFTSFVMDQIKVQSKNRIHKEVLDNSHRIMETMLWEIQYASNVYTPTSAFDNDLGQLSLETQQSKPTDESTTYIDFYLDNNQRLCVKRERENGQILTSENIKITNLVFDHLTTPYTKGVQIQLTAVYDNPQQKTAYRATTTLTSSAFMRN